jgi:glutamyl-tRNA reductase
MNYLLIGVNHKTAPVEVRERLAIPDAQLAEADRRLAQHPGIEEGMVLSTCNRVEFLARSTNGKADLCGFVCDYLGIERAAIAPHLYERRGADAIRHVLRVAASLDSMIVGEPQILGQVKEAYATARAVGAIKSDLEFVLTRSFAVAKRVRTETAIGTSAVSVASVAVELALKIFGSLKGKKVFLVGAGKMSELAARHLLAHGATQLTVANRTFARAEQLARKFDGETVDQADIVITSTGSPEPIFRREHGEKFLARRKNRPMFFIDIAVPRDVDAALAKLDGMFVYDIDDLQSVAASHVADRQKEAQRAEAIIEAEVRHIEERAHTAAIVPTIVFLQEQLETIRQAEIDRVRGRLGELSPEQELAIEAMTRGIVNKILHAPITTLKTAARESQQATNLDDLVRRLFNLPDKKSEG